MSAWLAQHGRGFAAAISRLVGSPLGSMLNVLTIGIALSLPVGLYVAIDNIQAASRQISGTPQVSVFMALDAGRADAAQVATRLKQNTRVRIFRFVRRDQALQELKQASGLADVIESLPNNPLPDAFIIDAHDTTLPALEALRDEIKQWPRVAHVQMDAAWARRLDAALRLGRLIVWFLGTLLALALIAVAFNTIRLQVLTRRDEIEVARLIGATDAFIRRPFLYFGALQGLAGGVAAWLVVSGGVWLLNRNLGELSHVYASLIELRTLDSTPSLLLLLISAALGWLGARLSVGKNLGALDPESV